MNSLKIIRELMPDLLIDRRKFIRMGLITAAAALLPNNVLALDGESVSDVREIHFYNSSTHEDLKVVYWKDGEYVPEALSGINYLFRDTRTGDVKVIETELLEILFNIRKNINAREPFHIVCGYRSPQTNALLRKQKRGVAKDSLHMYGKAVDIRIPGFSLNALKYEANKLGQGGVGYYPRAHFVHIDVGEVRHWRG